MAATYATGKYGLIGGTYADLDGDDPPPTPDDDYVSRPSAGVLGRREPRRPVPLPKPLPTQHHRHLVVMRMVVTQSFATSTTSTNLIRFRAASQPAATYRATRRRFLKLANRRAVATHHSPESLAAQIAMEDEELLVIAAELFLREQP